jgi:flagellar basal body-associated protein FliL
MAKDVINAGGEQEVVREDTAKSYRGVIWALLSVGAFVIIAAILMLSGLFSSASDDKPMESPAQLEQKRN